MIYITWHYFPFHLYQKKDSGKQQERIIGKAVSSLRENWVFFLDLQTIFSDDYKSKAYPGYPY